MLLVHQACYSPFLQTATVCSQGGQSLTKDAIKYAEGLQLRLTLEYPDPKGYTEDGEEIQGRKIRIWAKAAQQTKQKEEMREERWQGKLLNIKWKTTT